jgi:hypothetical protein
MGPRVAPCGLWSKPFPVRAVFHGESCQSSAQPRCGHVLLAGTPDMRRDWASAPEVDIVLWIDTLLALVG